LAEKLLLDSSVAVALLMEDYMAGHALFETMFAHTRLPGSAAAREHNLDEKCCVSTPAEACGSVDSPCAS